MKKATRNGLNVKEFTDRWSEAKERLEALAHEQTQADIALVEANRTLAQAQKNHAQAIARKTLAEKRLSSVRGNLGE